jgi:hypothetical protein
MGFVLFLFILLFVHRQQRFNKIIPIMGPECAQLQMKRNERLISHNSENEAGEKSSGKIPSREGPF